MPLQGQRDPEDEPARVAQVERASDPSGITGLGFRPFEWLNHRFALVLIACTALYARLLHIFSYESSPSGDMAAFVRIAVHDLKLENIFQPGSFSMVAPGYSLFLKPFYFLFDEPVAARWVQVAQALLGAWTCVLVYRLARRMHSRRAGLVAALITCFYSNFLFFTSHWMPENLFIPALLAALLLFMRAVRKPGTFSFLRAGAGMAAAMLIRPPAACLAPAVLYVAWLAAPELRGKLRAFFMISAGFCLLVLPWTLNNYLATGQVYLISPDGPYHLAVGNAPEATGGPRPLPSPSRDFWESRSLFKQEVGEFVSEDPLSAIHVVLRLKWRSFWRSTSPWPISTLNPRGFFGEHYFPQAGWQLVLVLGLAGSLLGKRSAPAAMTMLVMATYVGFFMLLYGEARFRLPIEALFIAWSGVAVITVSEAVPKIRRLSGRQWATGFTLLLALLLVQTEADAAMTRRQLSRTDLILAQGGHTPVLPLGHAVHLFDDERISIDRSAGHYLMLSFKIFRSGPPRPHPANGWLEFIFTDQAGNHLNWMKVPRYEFDTLPDNRWVNVNLKIHIPPAATAVEPRITPSRSSPDLLVVDFSELRHMRGNDIAGEFLSRALLMDD
jgi:4-amino-4-deoxy-L-arabinose transferase-like glycosyltransferase